MRFPMRARFLLAGAMAASLAAIPGSADAVPPANDDIRAATAITSVPAAFEVDTREATASPGDGSCVFGASVWYRLRPAATQTLRVVTLGSDYDTVLALFSGRRADRQLLKCRDDTEFGLFSAMQHRFEAGQTYWIAVSTCCGDGRRGRSLDLSIYPPTTVTVETTIDEVVAGDVSGRLIVKGTTTCDPRAAAFVYVRASQRVGDFVARAESGAEVPLCSSTGQAWTATLDSETATAFRAGRVSLTVHTSASDGISVARAELSGPYPVGLDPNGRRLP